MSKETMGEIIFTIFMLLTLLMLCGAIAAVVALLIAVYGKLQELKYNRMARKLRIKEYHRKSEEYRKQIGALYEKRNYS